MNTNTTLKTYPKYRIVTDLHCRGFGYEVQVRMHWWSWWCQCARGFALTNTHRTVEQVREFAARLNRQLYKLQKDVDKLKP